jgi:hypothetical protein
VLGACAVLLVAAACQAGPVPTPSATPAASPSGSAATSGGTGGVGATSPTAVLTDPDAAPCVGAAPPARWKHVLWVWFENKPDVAVIGSPEAPYLNGLIQLCGTADDYHGITHPSLPNYLAATSGSTQGVQDDAGPQAHPVDGQSLFGQVAAAGMQWRSYQEGLPEPCARRSEGRYAVKHDAAAYYSELRPQCATWDVPIDALASDLAAGTLPAFAFVTPDLCHDTHDCTVATGDQWLSELLPTILHSPAYLDGSTAVFITYDEDDSKHDNRIPFVAVAPSVPPGTVFHGRADHYALLRTTESMLGLPPLGDAAAASALPGF